MLLSGIAGIINHEWRCLGTIEYGDSNRLHFNSTGRQFGIDRFVRTGDDLTCHLNHILLTQTMSQLVYSRIIRVDNNLNQAGTIAHINKYNTAVIAIGLRPPVQAHRLPDMMNSEITAMCAC